MSDFSELEDRLRKLRPVQPSADLVARVEHALAEESSTRLHSAPARQAPTAAVLPRERRFQLNWLSLGLGVAAAAALVMFALLRVQQPSKKTPAVASASPAPAISTNSNTQLIPAGLTQVVYHTRDEGLHFPSNSAQPMRRVRSHTRETLQWRNPTTGATLRISYPQEEISLTPISGQ
jgi:negative regulator of sigma E activity